MGTVRVENIRIYAYHGCLNEETRIGSYYSVNVTVKANLTKASNSDRLSDTVDYVRINKIVKEEMATPSKLLENAAKRIIDRLVQKTIVSVSKVNPPIGGDVEKVTVRLKSKRIN